jgi:hypothetical protein
VSQSSLYYVSETKRQAETISYFGDFRDVLATGETITSETVTVSVITGTDPNPSAMLYGGIDLDDAATVIEQRIEQGVVGCIYDIVFTVGTSLGNTYEKFTRLTILPTNVEAEALHSTWYMTSDLYPYNMDAEGVQGQAYMSPTQYMLYKPQPLDQIQGAVVILTGSLLTASLTYSMKAEDVQGNCTMQTSSLVVAVVDYNYYPQEAVQGNVALLNSNLFGGAVSYRTNAESVQGDCTMQNGTLM